MQNKAITIHFDGAVSDRKEMVRWLEEELAPVLRDAAHPHRNILKDIPKWPRAGQVAAGEVSPPPASPAARLFKRNAERYLLWLPSYGLDGSRWDEICQQTAIETRWVGEMALRACLEDGE